MSNVIDELRVVFSAETGGLSAQLTQIGVQMAALAGNTGAAQTAVGNLTSAFAVGMSGMTGAAQTAAGNIAAAFTEGMADMTGAVQSGAAGITEAFAGGLETLDDDAQATGAGAGSAFATGLRSQAGSVRSAAAYLASAAAQALGGTYTGGTATVGFSEAAMSGGSVASSGGRTDTVEITVPLNVDGVRLGEACIRAMGRVAGITGRAHAVI